MVMRDGVESYDRMPPIGIDQIEVDDRVGSYLKGWYVSKTNRQEKLEQDLRAQLLQDGSADIFSAAYDQFHNHVLEHGMWGKPPFRRGPDGSIYRKHIDPIDKLLLRLIGPGSCVLLDIGMGDGSFITACSRQGNRVVGLDVSKVALQAARRGNHNSTAYSLLQGDARNLGFSSESFQFVVSKDLIEHLREEDVPAHLKEVKRVLRPGGRYLLWTPPPGIGHSQGLHLKEYTVREVLGLLEKEGFTTEVIPLHLMTLGLPLALKPHSWPLRLFLGLEALAFFLRLPKLTQKLPLVLRFALLPSACIVASKWD
jgi:SAM-dependent methyltransferase